MSRLTRKMMGQVVLPVIPMEIKTKEDLNEYHKVRREYEAMAIKLAEYEDKEDDEHLKLLNSIEIIDYSISSDEVEYIEIEDNAKNVEILKKLGATDEDFEAMRDCNEGSLEILEFAFKFADWFSTKEGFSINNSNSQY